MEKPPPRAMLFHKNQASKFNTEKALPQMPKSPLLIAMDLEGVLVPEIWIAVAKETGIEKLRLTTRDISDYDELMRGRLQILRDNGLKLDDIQNVISTLSPLPGAKELLAKLRASYQVVILSDTFYEFAAPLMKQLDWPTLFCNFMNVDKRGAITDYHLRKNDGKRHAVAAFKALNFTVLATGDSYNDTTMLSEAHCGILFRPSANVKNEFPQFDVAENYEEMWAHIEQFDSTRKHLTKL
jgi:phosphoserine/homoserine phosphotransferase